MRISRSSRVSAAIGATVMALGALVACTPSAGGGGEGEGAEIVWAIGGARSQPGGANQRIAALWNEQNPDTPVRIEALPEGADGAREQQALVLQAGGSEFDVLGLDVVWTGEYVENGWLENLEHLRSDLEDAILPGPMESASWGGDLWAVPMNTNTGVLYYRTDLVDEAPTTWSELCDVAERVGAEDGIGGFMGQGARYEGFTVNWMEMYWSAGGNLFNEDQSEVAFDVDTATEVTEFMAEAVADGCFGAGYNTAMEEETRIAFQSGDVAFMRNWPGPYALIADDAESPAHGVTAVASLPSFDGVTPGAAAIGGNNNAVSAFSAHKDLATDFIVWAATDEDAQMILVEDAVLPAYGPIYESLTDDPYMQQLGEILRDARARPAAPQWSAISLEIQRTLFEAVNGQMDARDAAEQMRAFLEETL